jgi:glyoxylase-like metal-dependent hydrolase (beta-lactamase superfamily II)
MTRAWICALSCAVVWGCASESGVDNSGPEAARTILEASLRAMGTIPAAGVEFSTDGTLDKSPEGQGFNLASASAGPFRERIAVDPSGAAVARHYREDRYDGTFEWVGEVYGPGDTTLVILPALQAVLRSTDPAGSEPRARIRRRVPHLLIRELLDTPNGVRSVRGAGEGGLVRVETRLDGREATLAFGTGDTLLAELSFDEELEGLGRSRITWLFDEYRSLPDGLWFPERIAMHIGDRVYLDLRVSEVRRPIADPDPFTAPDSARLIDLPPDPEDAEGDDPGPPLEPMEVAEGIYQVPNVRGGFAPIFVEFDDFVIAVDAPAGFPLLPEIPPGHTDPAPHWSHHAERFVDAIHGVVPGKPIRYVVLTHGHQDHIGGVRAFVAAGATVLGPPQIRAWVQRLVSDTELGPDRLTEVGEPLSWEDVAEPRVITDGRRQLHILPVDGNPHADGMLVVHEPDADLMFVSDLVTPNRLEVYPRASHRALDQFFLLWLDAVGLAPARILAMHGAGELTPEHLARLRQNGRDS